VGLERGNILSAAPPLTVGFLLKALACFAKVITVITIWLAPKP
jgi:hypothetical protein